MDEYTIADFHADFTRLVMYYLLSRATSQNAATWLLRV
jgi:hypothetical protein